MADPVSLALGIAPLCFSVFKGFKVIHAKLRAIRHGSHELSRLKNKYHVQSELFRDECEYILRDILDSETASNMISDLSEPAWSSKGLESKFRAYLGGKYETFKSTVEDIAEINDDLRSTIEKWDEYLENGDQSRSAFAAAFKTSKFKQDLEHLTDLNSILRTLRKRVKETRIARGKHKALPSSILEVRRTSASLHTLLSQHWSCHDPAHLQHIFRLLVDADVGDVVTLRGIVQTDSRTQQTRNVSMLQIVSKNLQWTESSSAPESSAAERQAKVPRRKHQKDVSIRKEKLFSIKAENVSGECESSKLTPTATSTSPLDLRFCDDLCARFLVHQNMSNYDGPSAGYYLVDASYKHEFELCLKNPFSNPDRSDYETLSDILGHPLDHATTVVDQLNIALALIRATLQFWSTPWWRTYWSLGDIGILRERKAPVLSDTVKSIHVNVDLRNTETAETAQAPTTGNLAHDDVERATLTFGIRNLNLYCLGVALLQVGRWSTVQIDDVETVRRLAALPSHLGPKYREITEKCLECDFGVGKKVHDIRLQAAIYDSVARPIESMVKALSLNDDPGSQSEF